MSKNVWEGYEPKECYYCHKIIENYADEVIKGIPVHKREGVVLVDRHFHIGCVNKMIHDFDHEKKHLTEHYWFLKASEIAENILGYDKGSTYLALRIKGMRIGKFLPTGHTSFGIKGGYSYETIFKTFLFVSSRAKEQLRVGKFKDEKHRVNFLMYMLDRDIAFMDKKLKEQERANKKLSRVKEDVILMTEEEMDIEVRDIDEIPIPPRRDKFADVRNAMDSILGDDKTDDDFVDDLLFDD